MSSYNPVVKENTLIAEIHYRQCPGLTVEIERLDNPNNSKYTLIHEGREFGSTIARSPSDFNNPLIECANRVNGFHELTTLQNPNLNRVTVVGVQAFGSPEKITTAHIMVNSLDADEAFLQTHQLTGQMDNDGNFIWAQHEKHQEAPAPEPIKETEQSSNQTTALTVSQPMTAAQTSESRLSILFKSMFSGCCSKR